MTKKNCGPESTNRRTRVSACRSPPRRPLEGHHRDNMTIDGTDNLGVLDSKHMMTILLYIYRNGPVTKNSLYENVCRNVNMPHKLDMLEDEGLIMQKTANRATLLQLTEKGKGVSRIISILDDALSVG